MRARMHTQIKRTEESPDIHTNRYSQLIFEKGEKTIQ